MEGRLRLAPSSGHARQDRGGPVRRPKERLGCLAAARSPRSAAARPVPPELQPGGRGRRRPRSRRKGESLSDCTCDSAKAIPVANRIITDLMRLLHDYDSVKERPRYSAVDLA